MANRGNKKRGLASASKATRQRVAREGGKARGASRNAQSQTDQDISMML